MRQFWVALAVLAAMAAGVWWHCAAVGALSDELTDLLTRAEAAVQADAWAMAEQLTGEAKRLWADSSTHLNMTLRHSDIDQVRVGLEEVSGYLRRRDANGYYAAGIRLRDAVHKLYEMERLILPNLL